jgi:hypothetical protein
MCRVKFSQNSAFEIVDFGLPIKVYFLLRVADLRRNGRIRSLDTMDFQWAKLEVLNGASDENLTSNDT